MTMPLDELTESLKVDIIETTQLGADAIVAGDHASKVNDLFGIVYAATVLKEVNVFLTGTYEAYDVCTLTPEAADAHELSGRRLLRTLRLLQRVEAASNLAGLE